MDTVCIDEEIKNIQKILAKCNDNEIMNDICLHTKTCTKNNFLKSQCKQINDISDHFILLLNENKCFMTKNNITTEQNILTALKMICSIANDECIVTDNIDNEKNKRI